MSASNLVNADGLLGKSDPYVKVELGFQSAVTQTIHNNQDPIWNRCLTLPVNKFHESETLDISVWDEDEVRSFQGSDDFLGRISVPMLRLFQRPDLTFENEKLLDTSKGTITVRLYLDRGGSRSRQQKLQTVPPAFTVAAPPSQVQGPLSAFSRRQMESTTTCCGT